ncbi:MAG: tetratricopeptide repeat protein [Verrucomicrobiota bacterium]|nr:tetratricopeptide repeat protein [Verrucomicrobiota bacterium]
MHRLTTPIRPNLGALPQLYLGIATFILFDANPLDLVIPETEGPDQLARCEQVMRELDQVQDIELLFECQEFYWHAPDHDDPPGSYQNITKLIQRSLELDPFQADQYANLAFLYYSQWCSWKKRPEEAPYGAGGAEGARNVLEIGSFYCWNNAQFHIEAGLQFSTMARYHDPAFHVPAIRFLEWTAALPNATPAQQARALISIGHIHRAQGDKAAAREAYQMAIRAEPDNLIAPRQIRLLERSDAGQESSP